MFGRGNLARRSYRLARQTQTNDHSDYLRQDLAIITSQVYN